jgi:hypothetical protein
MPCFRPALQVARRQVTRHSAPCVIMPAGLCAVLSRVGSNLAATAAATAANFLSHAPNAGDVVGVRDIQVITRHTHRATSIVTRGAELAVNQFMIDDPVLQYDIGSSIIDSSSSSSRPCITRPRSSSLLRLLLVYMTPLTDTALLVAV